MVISHLLTGAFFWSLIFFIGLVPNHTPDHTSVYAPPMPQPPNHSGLPSLKLTAKAPQKGLFSLGHTSSSPIHIFKGKRSLFSGRGQPGFCGLKKAPVLRSCRTWNSSDCIWRAPNHRRTRARLGHWSRGFGVSRSVRWCRLFFMACQLPRASYPY